MSPDTNENLPDRRHSNPEGVHGDPERVHADPEGVRAESDGEIRSTPEKHALLRGRLLRRFEVWLDEILDGEQAPEGIAAEILDQLQADPADPERSGPAPDLYSLWSSVTAMTGETRLQARSFKRLREELTPMQEMVRSVSSMLERYEQALDRQETKVRDSIRNEVLDDVLDVLIDIRDRLVLGREAAQNSLDALARPLSGLRSLLGSKKSMTRSRETIAALIEGYELCGERLDEALARFGVRPIDCVGRPFDPAAMKAVDIDDRSDAGEGTVVEVYRTGYLRDDGIHRPAEVKVARRR